MNETQTSERNWYDGSESLVNFVLMQEKILNSRRLVNVANACKSLVQVI